MVVPVRCRQSTGQQRSASTHDINKAQSWHPTQLSTLPISQQLSMELTEFIHSFIHFLSLFWGLADPPNL